MKTAYIFDVYDDYAIRLKYVRDALEEQGYQVTIWLADFDHFHKEPYQTKRDDAKYIPVMPYQSNFSYARIRSHMKFAESCLAIQKQKPADLCYVMVPPNSMARLFGKYHKKNPSFRLIFDLCDMWPESFPTKGLKGVLALPFAVWASMRDRWMKYGDLIMSECGLFAKMLEKHLPKEKTEIFWLCRPSAVREVLPVENDTLTFAYLGSINHVVDIEGIAALANEVSRLVPVRLHIVGDGEERKTFLSLLDGYGINYEYHGLVFDEEEKQKIFRQCHYGFNMMKDTTCIGLTMKSLDYLAYDLPLINSVPGDTEELVRTEKIGVNVTGYSETAERIACISEQEYTAMRQNVLRVFEESFSDDVFRRHMKHSLENL